MSVLVVVSDWDAENWARNLRTQMPGRKIDVFQKGYVFSDAEKAAVRYLLAWKPPQGVYSDFPNLSVVFSLGAGVDHIVKDPDLPSCPLVRVVDPDLTARMGEWIVLQVLTHLRQARHYGRQQQERLWQPLPQPPASAVTVGILGMGVLGTHAAALLSAIGFPVIGWSRTKKSVSKAEMFFGEDGLSTFLSQTDILVSLLPHTPATEGLLTINLFRQLRGHEALGGAFFINAGRGQTQVDDDIVRALDEGVLAGASLDVFETEPLPAGSGLWGQPNAIVTPHVAADSDPAKLASYIARQIERYEKDGTLDNLVDRERGY